MVVKTKSKAKPQAKPKVAKAKNAEANKRKSIVLGHSKASVQMKTKTKSENAVATRVVRVVNKISPPSTPAERKLAKGLRVPQYNYMKAPGLTHDFQVGDSVEVYCDHEKNRDRVRGWIGGIVVQVDNKMVAVQFRSNVFLTDGWMVPDRILWYPLNSEHIRPVVGKKSTRRDVKLIPEY
jgi:hypothetical protein